MERCDRVLARKTKFPIGMGTKAEDITGRRMERGTAILLIRFGADGGAHLQRTTLANYGGGQRTSHNMTIRYRYSSRTAPRR
jgi:hypothetical protein